jgi:integrase/recombinase XerD
VALLLLQSKTMGNDLDLSKAIAEYLSFASIEKGLAKNTISAYRLDLEKFMNFMTMEKKNFEDVDSNLMDNFLAWLRGSDGDSQSATESSNSRAIVVIRNLFKFIATNHRVVNPIQNYSPPAIPKRLPKALKISEVIALIDAAKLGEDSYALRNTALIEVLYATGARISEITELELTGLSQIDENFTIKLLGKGSKERVVPIGNFARLSLENYLTRGRPDLVGKRRSQKVFLNSRGDGLSRQSAWEIISTVAERAKISAHVTPHSLRHSFATHLLDGGADIRVVQELLGHSSVTTTQIYTLITIDKLRESYASSHPRAL